MDESYRILQHRPAVRPAEVAGKFYSDAEITGVMICTPAYGGVVTARNKASAIGAAILLHERLQSPEGARVPVLWTDIEGESLIERARCNGIARFMAFEPKLSHLILIDADIEWKPEDLLRLIAHDRDVVFGLYPKKIEPIEYAFHPLTDEKGIVRRDPVTGAVEITRGSTGFMCIKRRVFEEMAKAYPRLKYRSLDLSPAENRWLYGFMEAYIDDSPEVWDDELGGILWSEDYGFCNRWRAIGGEVWCDPEIDLNHIGQKVYSGNTKSLFKNAPIFVGSGSVRNATLIPTGDVPSGGERIFGWVVPKGDPWFEPLLRQTGGFLDHEVILEALERVTDFGCAIDVGGHIGTWTRPLAGRFERVVTIEPNSVILPLLQANLEGHENVKILHGAAWSVPAVLRGYPGGYNSGEYSVAAEDADGGDEDGSPVSGICIDGLGLEHVGLIKIDVEGSELQVLEGATQTLLRWHPVVVVEEEPDRAVSEWLRGFGMVEVSRHPIVPGHPKDNVVMVWPEAAAALAAE